MGANSVIRTHFFGVPQTVHIDEELEELVLAKMSHDDYREILQDCLNVLQSVLNVKLQQ